MPRKSKGKHKPFKNNRRYAGAEVFRNSAAVLDDTDPHQSLKYMQDIFKDKIEVDVITMIFSECAYNVEQAFDTLMSLCNEEDSQHHFNKSEDQSISIRTNISASSENTVGNNNDNSETATNFPTFQNKSKLAINFSHPLNNFIQTPIKNIENFGNDFKKPKQREYFGLSCNNASNETDRASLPLIFGNFSRRTTDSDNSNSHISLQQNVYPQFITPFLPTPLHKCGFSPHLPTNLETGSTFLSRNFHMSPPMKNKIIQKKCQITKAHEKIKSGSHILVIIRGLPGSGKSTLSKKLKYSGVIFSTDDFFINKGKYVFDPFKLSEAHSWNKSRTKRALEKGITPVIIDNTNVEAWEITPYILMGKKYNYEIIILEPDTPWKFNVNELSLKNKHGISKSKLIKMKEKYQHNITVDNILASVDLLDSKNVTDFCKDKDFKKIIVKDEEGKIVDIVDHDIVKSNIFLEADIHQEDSLNDVITSDKSSFENLSFFDSSSITNYNVDLPHDSLSRYDLKDIKSNVDLPDDNICDNNSLINQTLIIHNLDELRALVRENSDDSQSIHSSVNDSLHDASGWEAITEHDEDFLWSTDKDENNSMLTSDNNIVNFINPNIAQLPFQCIYDNKLLCKSMNNSIVEKMFEDVSKTTDSTLDHNLSAEKYCFLKNAMPETDSENSKNSDYYFSKYNDQFLEKDEMSENNSTFSALKATSNKELGFDSDKLYESEASKLPALKQNILAEECQLNECIIIREQNSLKDGDNIKQIIEPKPPRINNNHYLSLSKESLILETIDTNLIAKEDNLEWNAIENDIHKEKSKIEDMSNLDVMPVPKPQRNVFNNISHETSDKISCNDKPSPKKSILNISLGDLNSDWLFPDYISTSIKENQNLNEQPIPLMMSIHSQTEPYDFASVYKLSVEKNSVLDCTKYSILIASLTKENTNEISIFSSSFGNSINEISKQTVKFDKSTNTDDLVDDIEISQKLTHLHECFPDISIDDLHHLLEICHNDETWMSDLLLEWGYKYNIHVESVNNNNDDAEINMEMKDDSVCDSKKSFVPLLNENCLELSLEEKQKFSYAKEIDINSEFIDTTKEITEYVVNPHTTSVKKLHLILDPAFAYQLEELFGPVSKLDSNGDRNVEIDFEFARLIHSKWKKTVDCTKTKTYSEETDDFACMKIETEYKEPSLKANIKDPLSLSEIMDLEYALQLHKQEKLKRDTDFGIKLKRLELYNMFPGADTITLDEIFESNNYSLKDSIIALGEDIGQIQTNQQQKQNVEKVDESVVEWSNSDIFQEFETGDWSSWVYKEDNNTVEEAIIPNLSTTISPEAAELRELAAKHYQLRQEFIGKAQAAYCKGMKDVASFYAQKGAEHGLLFKDANKKASTLISQQRNMLSTPHMLDLHGLYIQEAIPKLEKFLRRTKVDLKKTQQTAPLTISIITGQGLHSVKGPKLRPSVLEYLKNNGYNFSEIKCGVIEVYLSVE